MGLTDGLAAADLAQKMGTPVCGNGVAPKKLMDAFLGMARRNPQVMKEDASTAIAVVAVATVPCRKPR
jgi:hypothetical protein